MSKSFSEWKAAQPDHAPETFAELVQDAEENRWPVGRNGDEAIFVMIPAPYEVTLQHPMGQFIENVLADIPGKTTFGQLVYADDFVD